MVHSSRQLTRSRSSESGYVVKPIQFFKIINSSSVAQQNLKIPTKFMRKYGKDLESLIILKVPSGAVWEVELLKSDDKAYLCKGWEEFTKFYFIDLWHFLVFKYQGNSSFHVTIFDMSASEIEYPVNPIPTHCSNFSTNMILHVPKREEEVRMVKMSGNKGSTALEMARNFKSKNPHFTVTMHKGYVSDKCGMNVPYEFAKKHIRKKIKVVGLQVSDRRVWSAKCYWYARHKKCFLDCVSFARDNEIKVGDVCVFELIDRIKPLMNVTAYRKSEI